MAMAPPDPSRTKAAARELRGTILLSGEDALELDADSGSFVLGIWTDQRATRLLVPVSAGKWTVLLPSSVLGATVGISLSVDDIVLGGRSAVLAEGTDYRFAVPPSGGELTFVAHRLSQAVIYVRDALTGENLSDVLVLDSTDLGVSAPHPGIVRHSWVTDYAGSPIIIVAPQLDDRTKRVYYVRGNQYAWARVELDLLQPRPRVVQTELAGNLRVQLSGVNGSQEMSLHVFRLVKGREMFYCTVPVATDGTALLEWLPVGAYHVTASSGAGQLAFTDAAVSPGDTTHAIIDITSIPSVVAVELQGTLQLPSEWGFTDYSLVIEDVGMAVLAIRREEMAIIDDTQLHWNAGPVSPGIYAAGISELPYRVRLEVTAQSEQAPAIVIPPPCAVSVCCVDASTGASVNCDKVMWSCRRLKDLPVPFLSAALNRETGCWDFRAPQGPIIISLRDVRYQPQILELGAKAGHNAFSMTVSSAAGVLIKLRDGDASVAISPSSIVSVNTVEGSVRYIGWTEWTEGLLCRTEGGGRLEVKLAALGGYRTIPPQTVEVHEGAIVEHLVQLERVTDKH